MNDPQIIKVLDIAANINNNPDSIKFAIPEVKGRLLYILTDPSLPQNLLNNALQNSASHGNMYMAVANSQMEQIETAILNILSYVQTKHDYDNVVTHMSLNPMEKISQTQGEERLYNNLPQNGFTLPRLQQFHLELDNNELIYAFSPPYNQPVQPNSEVLKICGP